MLHGQLGICLSIHRHHLVTACCINVSLVSARDILQICRRPRSLCLHDIFYFGWNTRQYDCINCLLQWRCVVPCIICTNVERFTMLQPKYVLRTQRFDMKALFGIQEFHWRRIFFLNLFSFKYTTFHLDTQFLQWESERVLHIRAYVFSVRSGI